MSEGRVIMKKLKCPIPHCLKAYRSRFTLRRHVEAFHYRSNRFSCQQCDKSFAYRHTLRKHVNRAHNNPINPVTSTSKIPLLTSLLRFSKDPEFNPMCKPARQVSSVSVNMAVIPSLALR